MTGSHHGTTLAFLGVLADLLAIAASRLGHSASNVLLVSCR